MSYGKHFESLLALVKAYIIDIWEERKSKLYGDVECAQQPVLTLQLGILGKLLELMGRIVKGCVREVSLAQVSCMFMLLRPHRWVRGRWPWGYIRQHFEYYSKHTKMQISIAVILQFPCDNAQPGACPRRDFKRMRKANISCMRLCLQPKRQTHKNLSSRKYIVRS